MTVKKGDTVKVQYTGSFDDGAVFDSSEGRDPLEFTVGSGQIIKGFDEALIGMKKGEEKNIHIPMEEAYGPADPQLFQKIPRNVLPKEREPEIGMLLGLVRADGKQGEARITEVSEQDITIDLNPPLAGKALNFTIKLLEIK